MNRTARLIGPVLLALAVFPASCREKKSDAPAGASAPCLSPIQTPETEALSDHTAKVADEIRPVEVSFEVDGVLSRILVKPGEGVRRGQVVAELDPAGELDTLKKDMKEAQAAAETARLRYLKRVQQREVGQPDAAAENEARREFEMAQQRLANARAQWESGLRTDNKRRARSPLDGRVVAILQSGGQRVEKGQPILRLAPASMETDR